MNAVARRSVRTWVVAHCAPGGDADDVAQRTFIEAFKSIAVYREGTDFRALADGLRRELAEAAVPDAASLAELAHDLGYSDHSAFTRAFRSATGMTPSEFRTQP